MKSKGKGANLEEKLIALYVELHNDIAEIKTHLQIKEKEINDLKDVLNARSIPIPENPQIQAENDRVRDWGFFVLETLMGVHLPIKRGELIKRILERYKLANDTHTIWNLNTKITSLAKDNAVYRARRKKDDRGGYYIPAIWVDKEKKKLKEQYKQFADGFVLDLKG